MLPWGDEAYSNPARAHFTIAELRQLEGRVRISAYLAKPKNRSEEPKRQIEGPPPPTPWV